MLVSRFSNQGKNLGPRLGSNAKTKNRHSLALSRATLSGYTRTISDFQKILSRAAHASLAASYPRARDHSVLQDAIDPFDALMEQCVWIDSDGYGLSS